MGNGQAVPQQMVGLFQTAFQYRRVCLPFIFLDLGALHAFSSCIFVHPLIHQVLSLIPHTAGIALIAILGIALLSDMIVTTSAIVKFNQYLELLKHITDELHAISNQIGAELYQNVMHVLDMQESSRQKLDDVKLEVSEEIRMQIVELKTRAQNLGEKVPKPARRLLKAFPKLESRNYKAQLELFRQKLEQHLGRH